MGKIMSVHPKLILPTQPRLNQDRFIRALREYKEKSINGFAPCPCRDCSQDYLALDGHSRISIATIFDSELQVYVPLDREDLMIYSEHPGVHRQAIEDMNYHIIHRFHKISSGLFITRQDYNVRSFEDLILKNREVIDKAWIEVFGSDFRIRHHIA